MRYVPADRNNPRYFVAGSIELPGHREDVTFGLSSRADALINARYYIKSGGFWRIKK